MELSDLSKDLQRLLMAYWSKEELNDRLRDPEYFFDQVVTPHFEYLKRNGQEMPRLRLQKTATGEQRVLLLA